MGLARYFDNDNVSHFSYCKVLLFRGTFSHEITLQDLMEKAFTFTPFDSSSSSSYPPKKHIMYISTVCFVISYTSDQTLT